MSAAEFRPGDLVDVTIRGAVVRAAHFPNDDTHELHISPSASSQVIPLVVPCPGVEVERVAPAEWPPVPGDLWRDKHGEVWFTYLVPTGDRGEPDLFMRTAGSRWCAGHERQIEVNGPWTLVHREPDGSTS